MLSQNGDANKANISIVVIENLIIQIASDILPTDPCANDYLVTIAHNCTAKENKISRIRLNALLVGLRLAIFALGATFCSPTPRDAPAASANTVGEQIWSFSSFLSYKTKQT